jgi:hypothetical protein
VTELIPYVPSASVLSPYDVPGTTLSNEGANLRVHSLQVGTELNLDPRPKQLQLSTVFETSDDTSAQFGLVAEAKVRGTSPAGPSTPYFGVYTIIQDHASVGAWSVTGAANNGSGLIRLTAAGHTLTTGDSVGVYGVTGTTEANGQWIVTVISSSTVDLQGSTFANAYVSGGTITNRGSYYGGFFTVSPNVIRAGLTGTAAFGDDVNGIGVFNGGTVPATSAYLVNRNSGDFPGTTPEFYVGLAIECNATYGIRMLGAYEYGIDFVGNNEASYSTGTIRFPNGTIVYGQNNTASADLALFRVRSDNNDFELLNATRLSGQVNVSDGINFDLGSTTGTKIGLGATQKLGFYNATPIVRPTGVAVTAAGVHAALVSLGLIAA